MQNKTVLITGGNDGIGKQTAIRLAQQGAHIVIACRNMKKATEAVGHIRSESGNERVEALPLDLASLASVQESAELFRSKYGRLDVLINNAGLFTSNLEFTEEGFELQFGVNHLGHFLLTNLLLPQLQMSDEPRVLNVSSTGHYGGTIDFDNLRGERGAKAYQGLAAYAQSKLANVLFTKELIRRYPQLTSHALHPGVVRTNIGSKGGNWLISLGWTIGKLFMISKEQGAETSVYLASSPEALKANGQYFNEHQQIKTPNKLALDEELAQRLWGISESFVADFLS